MVRNSVKYNWLCVKAVLLGSFSSLSLGMGQFHLGMDEVKISVNNLPRIVVTSPDEDSSYYSEKYALLSEAFEALQQAKDQVGLYQFTFLLQSSRELEWKAALSNKPYWIRQFKLLSSSLKDTVEELRNSIE